MRFLFHFFSVPELGNYSEEEYERLVWQAKLRRGDAIWVIPAFVGVLAAAVWIGIGVAFALGMKASGSAPSGAALRVWGLANIFVAILIGVAIGTAVRWMLLVRSIRRLINKAGCPFCEFSLVGLRIEHGWVRCPECGQRVYLHEHRLSPDDLVPEHERNKPLPALGAGEMGAYRPPPKKMVR